MLNTWAACALDGHDLWFGGDVFLPADERARCVRLARDRGMGLAAFKDGNAAQSLCVWVRCKSKVSVALLDAWPDRPSIVVLDGPVRRTAIWALQDPVPAQECERANRLLAYALRAAQKDGDPDGFVCPPGVERVEPLAYEDLGSLLVGLREPPVRQFA